MNSKCKIILGIILFALVIGVSVYYIRTGLSEAAVTSETNVELSNENNKNYLSPLEANNVFIKGDDFLANNVLNLNKFVQSTVSLLERKMPLEKVWEGLKDTVALAKAGSDRMKENFAANVYPVLTERICAQHMEESQRIAAEQAERLTAYLDAKFQEELDATTADLFSNCFATVDAKIEKYLNVRSEPNGDVVGILYPQTGGVVLETRDGWACISSGNLTGWVSMDYIAIGTDVATAGPAIYVTVEADTLMLREEPSTSSEIVDKLPLGRTARYLNYTAGWVYVDCGNCQGYVSSDYVRLTIGDNVAVTLDEQLWMNMLEEAGMLEPAVPEAPAETPAPAPETMAEAVPETVPETPAPQPEPAAPTADEQARARIDAIIAEGRSSMPAMYLRADEIYLLSCVVMMEAGNESYEGKLAVAGVVLNRIRSGYWGSTLAEVIYAPGQFSGANTGLLAGYMQSGPNEESVRAAYEACAGVHNISSYLFFCSTKSAQLDRFSSYYIIDKQCFYAR